MPGIVDIQDIAFGVHALLLTLITLGQCYHYDVIYTQKTIWKTGIHKINKIANLVLWVLAIIIASIELGGAMPHAKNWNGCLFLGYLKVGVTLTKYMPQVYLNYSRKSTVGWSIENVLLDFTGGMLSILQIFIDGANTGDWNVFGDGGAFNIAKFCLGFISIIFDIIFMLQHYVFYRHKETHKESWENPLIPMDDSSSKTRV
jgi:cystinosin